MSKSETELRLAASAMSAAARHLQQALEEMAPFSVDAADTRRELSDLHDSSCRVAQLAKRVA